jgi:pimeloyl-ACP methyl ester carboxylesterase
VKRIAILFLLLACGVAGAKPFAPTSFAVRVVGKGRPIILIPGLGCPGSVWDDTVAHFTGAQLHVLTLAGYAGQAPIDQPLSATVRAELAKYIRDRKLDHPVIIGHSLGGFIAFWLAESDPDLVGPTIAIDAFPALGYDPASVAPVAAMAESWKTMAKPEFDGQARDMFLAMAVDPKKVEPVIAAVLKSDRRTFADSFVELFKTDLRPDLPKIKARVLVILADGPYQQQITAQVAAIPSRSVVVLPKTRHFVMFDDPAGFYRAVDAFLKP